jgi:uridine kinase
MVKFTVGVTGGSGVGKTTLIDLVKNEFGEEVTVFSLDNYYLPKERQARDENGIINFDLPTALDTARMKSDLNKLYNNEPIDHQQYLFNNPNKDRKPLRLEPKAILIIEGLFVLHYIFIKEALNYSVYVSAPKALQLQRRLKRDVEERNYSEEDVMYQWKNHVLTSYDNYLLPYKDEADLIITNEDSFDENVQTLLGVIHNCKEMQAQ